MLIPTPTTGQGNSAAAAVSVHGGVRDLRLDVCRGLALCFIFLDHAGDNTLSWLTMRNYGLSDATEVFVFVSGYACMLAYGEAQRRYGFGVTVARALRRAWEIYAAFIVTVIAYVALVQVAGDDRIYPYLTNTGVFFQQPASVVHLLLMQYTPVNTDVLPLFVLLHALFPALLWLFLRNTSLALAASALLYLSVQLFSFNLPAWPRGTWYFNPLAWQFLFTIGAWYAICGWRLVGGIVHSRAALAASLAYLVVALCLALIWKVKALDGILPEALAQLIYLIDKSNLAPLRLLHFIALAVAITQLMPMRPPRFARHVVRGLIRCGENSLAIYCLTVLLVFLAIVVQNEISGSVAMQLAVGVAGIAAMFATAAALTLASKFDRHRTRLF